MDIADEKILKRIPLEIAALALLGALAAAILTKDTMSGLFVLLGGGLAALGFVSLKHSVTRFLGSDKRRAVRSAVLLYGLRLVLILSVFSIIILFFPGRIYAFIAGFSTVIVVFMAEAVAAFSRMKQWKS
jgi:hypothetical protein